LVTRGNEAEKKIGKGRGKGGVALAIGDGANDVGMIQVRRRRRTRSFLFLVKERVRCTFFLALPRGILGFCVVILKMIISLIKK